VSEQFKNLNLSNVIAPERPEVSGGSAPVENSPGKKEKKKFPIGARIAAGAAGVALAAGGIFALGTSGEGEPAPVATSSSEPAPEASTAPIPQQTEAAPISPESEYIVDYTSFENWGAKTFEEKVAVSEGFYTNNGIESRSAMAPENTGDEIMRILDAKEAAIFDLYTGSDSTQDQEVALNLLETHTSNHDTNGGDAKVELLFLMDQSKNSNQEFKREQYATVTRYSDGLQSAADYAGIRYPYKAVEYRITDEYDVIPSDIEIRQALIEWNETAGWQRIGTFTYDIPLDYGTVPPIVEDPLRQDAPWQK